MKKIILLMVLFLGISTAFSQNTKTLLSSNQQETIIEFNLEDYYFQAVQTPYGEEFQIKAPETSPILLKDAPDLLKMTASIVIPDNGSTKIEVISENYQEYPNVLIAPSKGNLTRDIDPNSIDYNHGKYYKNNEFFPGQIAELNSPYIVRDYRGQVVNVYPFQYNPVTKKLRVYSDIKVKVTTTKNKGVNELVRQKSFDKVSFEFNQIYKHQFINYGNSKYTPVEEEGNMLIICYDDWTTEMEDFVDWKNTIGRPCEMVTVTEAGGTAANIATYVENYYNDNGLTYLLLVGDAAQVPTNSGSGLGGDSDNAYAYILGDDHYLDFFVGRFSAESASDVETQVQRTITYENGSTLEDDWLNVPTGVASDQGPGEDNEYDYQHIQNILTQLVDFTYTDPYNEIYDGSQGGYDASGNATPAQVATAINSGTGIICYTGHGSDFSWVSSGFDVSDVNSLTNDNKLPFIFSVACVNGNFVGQTCFGESWLRATNGDNPTGAMAIMASTINQSWDPPMAGQDEMIDILTESYANNIKRTFAGIAINGCHLMNDETSDFDMTDTWTCFGDPSLMVRTDDAADMTISHDDVIIMGSTDFSISCNLDGALATISKDGVIIGSAYVSGGTANIPLSGINPGEEVTIAVVGFNQVTYLAQATVVAPDGPYVSMTSCDINGSETMNYNSSENLNIILTNFGPDAATGITATITTDDPNITLSNNENISFGDIAGDGATASANNFVVTTSTNVPDQYVASLHIVITSSNKESWEKDFNLTINAPELNGLFSSILDEANGLAFASSPVTLVDVDEQYSYNVAINELGGNNNGLLDPGENVTLSFDAENIGHAGIYNTYGHLTSSSDYVTINNSETYIDTLKIGESFVSDFNIEISDTAHVGESIEFQFIVGSAHYKDTLDYIAPIGLQIEDFESGDFSSYDWTQGSNAWTISSDAYEGTNSAQSSDIDSDESSELSLTCNVTSDGEISFWSKVSSEDSYDYLIFYIDGNQQDEWSGEVAWEENTYNVSAGIHTFKWSYEKDGSVSDGSDCAWIDYIIFPGHSPAKGAKSSSISATTIPTWLSLTDNGDGTALLSGTTPNSNVDEPIVLEATNGTNTVTQEFTIRVGVTKIDAETTTISFFPNPTTDILNINFDMSIETATLNIVDVTGKSFIKKELTQNNNQIDLNSMPAGVYFINLEIEGKIYQNKLIKK